MIAPPHPDDLALVKKWFRRLSEQVQAVDFAGAYPLFAEDMIAFGTFENFITGREAAERAQWRNVWPVTSGFQFRMDDIRAIVSPDRLTAIGMGVFDSTGYHEDGTPYERPAARP
jgi:ketosteroid isomerase-like protein